MHPMTARGDHSLTRATTVTLVIRWAQTGHCWSGFSSVIVQTRTRVRTLVRHLLESFTKRVFTLLELLDVRL